MPRRATNLAILLIGGLIGLAGATQYIADRFGYDPRLGFEIWRWRSIVFYWPAAAISWSSP
jgi:hypothetical protein